MWLGEDHLNPFLVPERNRCRFLLFRSKKDLVHAEMEAVAFYQQ